MFVDSHCHLDFPELVGQLDAILSRMSAAEVDEALCVSVTLAGFPQVLALAEREPRLWASAGVHPDTIDEDEPDVDRLLEMAAHPKVIAIGETGLDYYRIEGDAPWQRERFRTHIRAARACGKPLIIHTRAAAADTLRLMREERAEAVGGVMHCFTETWDTASAALDLGFYISFSGIVTFKNAADLRSVARQVPLDRLLIETDSPYLAPVPHRGRTNEPAHVRFVAECIARERGESLETIARASRENFERLFRPPRGGKPASGH
ncbi:MAG: TatD family hydrolase [Burkholderiaceae bacterium]